MENNIGNYKLHAAIWDWSGYDYTQDYEFFCKYARKYGDNILIPFCAIGEPAVYMAKNGFNVTAFDITPEMIYEAKKRFDNIKNLQFYEGDITDFYFNIPKVDFCYVVDFGHIHSIEKIKKSLININNHLRDGGGLLIEAFIPKGESTYSPPKTFYPINNPYKDKKVWKVGDGRYDKDSNRSYISQTVYIQDNKGNTQEFNHSFYLQNYTHKQWIDMLDECGFTIKNEYSNKEEKKWTQNDNIWICEAIKNINY